MSLAVGDEQLALATTARRWLAAHAPISAARAAVESDEDSIPPWWPELAGLGWLGLAVSEANGGEGYGLSELAVVVEQTGRVCLPGPLLPTAAVAIALDRWGDDDALVRRLVGGEAIGGVAVADPSAAWSGAVADVMVVPTGDGWAAHQAGEVEAKERPSFDATRRLGAVTAHGPGAPLRPGAPMAELVALLASAEAVGVAAWCVETAAEHARTRRQFGRPIGQFQAVKHRCADMLCALEAARAAVWDAARCFPSGLPEPDDDGWRLALHAAMGLAPQAAFRCAKDCIQVLGGIGYTWEHDAHLFLKRATAVRHLLPAPSTSRLTVAVLGAAGVRRRLGVVLPPEAETVRARIAADIAAIADRPKSEWNATLAGSGYLVPHWPRPWGLDAAPIEQLAIDDELARVGIRRRHLQVAGWVLPTLITYGTPEQQERLVPSSLRGETSWCQLFSEPEAGSDLASLTTTATRTDGGWRLDGQKVWTTLAHQCDYGLCLARTDRGAPRHEGIGCFIVDMRAEGVDIRPLRELTGMALFNEVFLTDVFVPDDDLVGGPTQGWDCARTTLANERVSMASGSSFGPGVAALMDLAADRLDDPLVADQLGGLLIDAHALAVLGTRTTLRALAGQPGPEASVRKLLGVEHEQAVQEAGLALLGPDAAVTEGAGASWTSGFLGNRALSIAGGTSEIQRNLIAERLLGLPKDP